MAADNGSTYGVVEGLTWDMIIIRSDGDLETRY